jgi:hypothetical protein
VNASNRHRRAQLRTLTRDLRSTACGRRALAGAIVAPVSVHLAAAGLSADTVRRFKSAFSRGLTPATTRTTVVKLKGRVTKRVDVKLYDAARVVAHLDTYRPAKDPIAAAEFAAAAARFAA